MRRQIQWWEKRNFIRQKRPIRLKDWMMMAGHLYLPL
jgi:hypothetical protein